MQLNETIVIPFKYQSQRRQMEISFDFEDIDNLQLNTEELFFIAEQLNDSIDTDEDYPSAIFHLADSVDEQKIEAITDIINACTATTCRPWADGKPLKALFASYDDEESCRRDIEKISDIRGDLITCVSVGGISYVDTLVQ